MSESAESPRQLAERLHEAVGTRLRAVYRYGGTAGFRDDPEAEARAQGMLVLVDAVDLEVLELAAPVAPVVARSGYHLRVMDAEELLRSADTFPVFSLQLLDTKVLLHGEDVLAALAVDSKDLRLRVEQALRNVSQKLADQYLTLGGNELRLSHVLRRAARRSLYLVKGLLLLKGLLDETARRVAPAELADASSALLEPEERVILRDLWSFGDSDADLEGEALRELYSGALTVFATLIRHADAHEETAK